MNILSKIPILQEVTPRIVLSCIRDKGSISRADIARKTRLHPSTITRIVAALMRAGLVREDGRGENGLGRKPIMLNIVKGAIHVLGVTIESTFVSGFLVNLGAEIIEKKIIKFCDTSAETIMDETKQIIRILLKRAERRGVRVAGIGVAMHGVIDSEKGICVFSPTSGAKSLPVVSAIENHFGLPVRIDNNARAMVLGEHWFGNGRGVDNLLGVKIGHTIGAGAIVNGVLYSGTNHSAGEIGHITVDFDGALCKCGNYGCLETVASIEAIVQKARVLVKRGEGHDLLKFVKSSPDHLDFEKLCDAAKFGEKLACQLWAEAGSHLGFALANAINILNPTKVLIGGDILPAIDFVLPRIQDIVANRSFKTLKATTIIEEVGLGSNAVGIGAATLIFKDIFTF